MEYFHHRRQAREGLELLRREVDANRGNLEYDAKVLAFSERGRGRLVHDPAMPRSPASHMGG